MGVNQSSSGVDKVNSIINAHFATGRIGQPGRGAFSITGQLNAMGGREVGGLASTLAAHMDFSAGGKECRPADRAGFYPPDGGGGYRRHRPIPEGRDQLRELPP